MQIGSTWPTSGARNTGDRVSNPRSIPLTAHATSLPDVQSIGPANPSHDSPSSTLPAIYPFCCSTLTTALYKLGMPCQISMQSVRRNETRLTFQHQPILFYHSLDILAPKASQAAVSLAPLVRIHDQRAAPQMLLLQHLKLAHHLRSSSQPNHSQSRLVV